MICGLRTFKNYTLGSFCLSLDFFFFFFKYGYNLFLVGCLKALLEWGKCLVKMSRLLPRDETAGAGLCSFQSLSYLTAAQIRWVHRVLQVLGHSWHWLRNGYCLTLSVIHETTEAKLKHGNLSWCCLSIVLDSSLIWWKGLDPSQCYWNPLCVWVAVTAVMHGPTLWKLAKAGPWLFWTKQKEASLTWVKGELCSVARNRAVIISLFFFRSVSVWYDGLACVSAQGEILQLSGPEVVATGVVSMSSCKMQARESHPAVLSFSPNNWGWIKGFF